MLHCGISLLWNRSNYLIPLCPPEMKLFIIVAQKSHTRWISTLIYHGSLPGQMPGLISISLIFWVWYIWLEKKNRYLGTDVYKGLRTPVENLHIGLAILSQVLSCWQACKNVRSPMAEVVSVVFWWQHPKRFPYSIQCPLKSLLPL